MPRMVNPAPVNHIQLLELKAGWREQQQPSVAAGLCRLSASVSTAQQGRSHLLVVQPVMG